MNVWRDDVLLGTPPDQITEAEKMRRLQDVSDRRCTLYQRRRDSFEEGIKWMEDMLALIEEENELDRRYPDVLPESE